MTNKVYILTNGKYPDIKSQIAGIYLTEQDAIKAFESLRKYSKLTKKNQEPKIVKMLANQEIVVSDTVTMKFNVSFDNNMNLIVANSPLSLSYYSPDDEKEVWAIWSPRESDLKPGNAKFNYNYKLMNNKFDDTFLIGECKISIDNSQSEKEIALLGRNLILKELQNQNISQLKNMLDHISIEINPTYDFIGNSVELLKIDLDNSFKDHYSKELVSLLRDILYNYRTILTELLDYQKNFKETLKSTYNDTETMIALCKNTAEAILSDFKWYNKCNKSLKENFKEFIIRGNRAFDD